METMRDLNPETIDKIQELIQINIDSVRGYYEAAGLTNHAALETLFKDIAQERQNNIHELQTVLQLNREAPAKEGSLKATVHRWWMDVRSVLSNSDVNVILDEAERGEDAILNCYKEVLVEIAGNPLSPTMHSQYSAIKKQHDKIRDLRDATKKPSE